MMRLVSRLYDPVFPPSPTYLFVRSRVKTFMLGEIACCRLGRGTYQYRRRGWGLGKDLEIPSLKER